MVQAWFLVALAATFAGYATYLMGLRRNLVEPNRASWLIWSIATSVEAATYAAVNPDGLQRGVFVVAAVACVTITAVLWHRSAWNVPTRTESLCIAASLTALAIWAMFRDAFWAHMLVVAAVPVSFWPTWTSVAADRRRERSPAWGLWAVGDLATLLVATRTPGSPVGEYAYILVELLCHASIWLMIGLATINPVRSLGFRRGRFFVLDAVRTPANLFRVADNHLGKAVFAAQPFAEGDRLIEFTGRQFRAARIPSLMRGASDRFIQVTPDHYMGPSGRIDDLVNHSCSPNAGLRFAGGVFLVAVRPIAAGEEVTWDYSTTLAESNWHMICQCRSPDCRRVVGNFATLSPERQEWFRARNLVAPYLRRKDCVARNRAA